MKKTLISLSLVGFFAATLLVPVVALGGTMTGPPDFCLMTHTIPNTTCPASGQCNFTDTNIPCGMCCLLNTVYTVTDWIFVALVSIAVFFVIMGAFKILTAKDSAEEVGKGRTYIMYAALGLLVAFLAKAVPQIVRVAAGF